MLINYLQSYYTLPFREKKNTILLYEKYNRTFNTTKLYSKNTNVKKQIINLRTNFCQKRYVCIHKRNGYYYGCICGRKKADGCMCVYVC